jgi:hypothetical protein
MTHSLSQKEMGKWREFKFNRAANYDYECECFLDFSIQRLGHYSDAADEMRSMAMESGSAPAAKPAGGHQDGPKKGGHSGRDDRKAWNNQSRFKSNQSNPNPNPILTLILIVILIPRCSVLWPSPKGPSSHSSSLRPLEGRGPTLSGHSSVRCLAVR